MNVKQGYDYDDVILEPSLTKINSRTEIRVTDGHGFYPLVVAPMIGIAGYKLVRECSSVNIYGILHRFYDLEVRKTDIFLLGNQIPFRFGVAVGLNEFDYALFAYEHLAKFICVDVANGYLNKVAKFVEKLRKYGIDFVMAGNVTTAEGADYLAEHGATSIRVGIGGGNLCTTRNVTGVGSPQLTAIESVNNAKNRKLFNLISDGGIKNSGNAVKSFACGADDVMIGSYFAQAEEADHEGTIYGGASERIQREYFGEVKSIEGVEKHVEKIAPLKVLVENFMSGIRSACTYLNSPSYMEIRDHAVFISTGKGTLK